MHFKSLLCDEAPKMRCGHVLLAPKQQSISVRTALANSPVTMLNTLLKVCLLEKGNSSHGDEMNSTNTHRGSTEAKVRWNKAD